MNVNLSAKIENIKDIKVDGLIGIDVIQFLEPFNQRNILNGKAFEVYNGLVPYGNIESFLFPNKIESTEIINYKETSNNYNHV